MRTSGLRQRSEGAGRVHVPYIFLPQSQHTQGATEKERKARWRSKAGPTELKTALDRPAQAHFANPYRPRCLACHSCLVVSQATAAQIGVEVLEPLAAPGEQLTVREKTASASSTCALRPATGVLRRDVQREREWGRGRHRRPGNREGGFGR